jgi:hypothetical protein
MPEAAHRMIGGVLCDSQSATGNERQDEPPPGRHVHQNARRVFAAPVIHHDTDERAALVVVDSAMFDHRKRGG